MLDLLFRLGFDPGARRRCRGLFADIDKMIGNESGETTGAAAVAADALKVRMEKTQKTNWT